MLVSEAAAGFKAVAEAAGVRHPVCRRHVMENVMTCIAEVGAQLLANPPPPPAGMDLPPDHLLADLESLEWIMLGLPERGAQRLEQLSLAYAPAPAPKKGEAATLWYRARNRFLDLWDNWPRLSCSLKLEEEGEATSATHNVTEWAIGWGVKERDRTLRGYKREESVLNVTTLTGWLLGQPAGYDLTPLIAA